jgi:hypothetical protein
MSVYLTDTPPGDPGFYGSNISPNQNKVEQFLSTIHSLRNIEFSSAEIYFEVSFEYNKFVELICEHIKLYIPNAKIYRKRLEYFLEWKKASTNIPCDTEVVLLKNNHDHIFTHSDSFVLYKFINDLNSFGKEYVGEISHWPESIGNLRSGKWVKFKNSDYYFVTTATNTIGTCLIGPDFFKSWWTEDFTGGSRIVRPDNPFGPWVEFEPISRIVPTCEFFRHLDGYGYAKVKAPIASPLRTCCTVEGNSIKHVDWTKGNYFHNKKKLDLPVEPKLIKINDVSTLINLALLGSAYKVNLKNLWYISRAFKFTSTSYSFLVLFLCITDKFFLRKTLNLFLPIYSGNTKLFKIRMLFVDQYRKLSIRHNLPPSIKEFLRIKI